MTRTRAALAALAAGAIATQAHAAESATAQVALTSHVGSTYTYDITLDDTGTTNLGTFWFAWTPGQDYLDSLPTSVSNPTGWTDTLTGSHNASDGTAIQWVASSDLVTPGNSLTGFIFSTPDGPDQIAGPSASHSSTLASTSFVYSGAPFSDSGFEFVASVPEPASAGLIVATLLVGVRRHRRA